MPAKDGRLPVASNRRARYDYEILETVECGILLLGSEVKSMRDAKVQLKDSYARVEDGEMWLHGVHVAPYSFATSGTGHEPERPRKLLLHRHEIDELYDRVRQGGLTLIPLAVYFSKGKAKVELGLARGRRLHDKRAAIAEKDAKREADRAMARGRRGE